MNMATIDNLTDQLQSQLFQNLVDLADFQNCRLVSKKWKRNVMNACRNKFHLVYPLTDSTLHTVHELKDAQVSFDICSFTGEDNEAWLKSGIELLLQTTESLQLNGSEVDALQIQKILGLAKNTLNSLSFKCLKKQDPVRPFLKMPQTFSALRKLCIGYYCSQSENETFGTFTSTLERWNTLDCGIQLPVLESLNLYFDCRISNYNYRNIVVTSEDLFRNYIAIGKLLLKYKQTLREVQINRVFSSFGVQFFEPSMFQSQWTEMERGLENLDDLNLNLLKLSTKPSFYYYPQQFNFDIEVLGRPKNLKNALFQGLILYKDFWPILIKTLTSCKTVNTSYLTSIKISLSLSLHRDPTMVINLEALKECRKLRTLWLSINTKRRELLFVRNVELLPKGISNLHLENVNYDQDRNPTLKGLLPSQQQVRWIIDNLRELESFSISLLIPQEETNEDNNNVQIEAADGEDDDARPQQQEDVNRLANINLNSFHDLITLPKLKYIQVDMMKAIAMDVIANGVDWQGRQATTLEDVRKYTDMCDAVGYTTTTTTSLYIGANHFNGFATLTIQRN